MDWVFDAGHVASRFIRVMPKLATTTTDIHIVSDHGNKYTLQLQEISNNTGAHFDSKVFIVPRDSRPEGERPREHLKLYSGALDCLKRG